MEEYFSHVCGAIWSLTCYRSSRCSGLNHQAMTLMTLPRTKAAWELQNQMVAEKAEGSSRKFAVSLSSTQCRGTASACKSFPLENNDIC